MNYNSRGPKISMGALLSGRGAGLGNEVFPWAKAYLGALVDDRRLLGPPWRLNPRRYDRDLASGGVLDSIKYISALALPTQEITSQDVAQAGVTDYYELLTAMRTDGRLSSKPLLKHTSGMDLGYLGIARARHFLTFNIAGSGDGLKSVYELDQVTGSTIRVGVHLRGNDFDNSARIAPGAFNISTPTEWYVDQIDSLSRLIPEPLSIVVAGDPSKRADFIAAVSKKCSVYELSGTAVSDVSALANCDLILPSISSFSMLAIFMSEALYTWPADHLHDSGGMLSIWGGEVEPRLGRKITLGITAAHNLRQLSSRAIPQREPAVWGRDVDSKLGGQRNLRLRATDLIYFGSLPVENGGFE